MDSQKNYVDRLKDAYKRGDRNLFATTLDELIWLEWDEVPAIIQSFDFKKIGQNLFYYYLFQSYFGDLSFCFFKFPEVLFSHLAKMRKTWDKDYEEFEHFFENLARAKSNTFVLGVKDFFSLIKQSKPLYFYLASLNSTLGDQDSMKRAEELVAIIIENYKVLNEVLSRVDKIFGTNLCGIIENPQKMDSLQDKIIIRHLDTSLRSQLLSGSYEKSENALKLTSAQKSASYPIERLENEFYHCLILWEMVLFGYFRAYLSRLNISIPPEVKTNPFKIVVQICRENPGMFPDFVEYFASKLETYSVMAIK